MYAIIAAGGKQYKVSPGDTIRVEKLDAETGESVTLDKVLLVSDQRVSVGKPYIKGATVSATVKGTGRADKVIVYKYKRKSGYHRKNGHRQHYTELLIDSVNR